MALLFMEGYDKISGNTGTAAQQDVKDYFLYHHPHQNWSGSSNPQVLTGRLGGLALSHGNDGFVDQNWWNAEFHPDDATDTAIVGLAVKAPEFNGNQTGDLLAFWDVLQTGGAEHIVILVEHGVNLIIQRGSTTIGFAPKVMQMNRWHYLEAKVTVSNSVGSVEVRINGKTVVNLSGIDTQNGGSAEISMVRFRHSDGAGNGKSLQFLIDDIYVCNDVGTVNNDFLGLTSVETLVPNAAGDSAQFTPSAGNNHDNVDDDEGDDGDTTYNQSTTSGHKDLFGCQDLTNITGTIHGVQVEAIARVTSATPQPIITKVKSSTTEGSGTTRGIASTPEYVGVRDIFEQDPDASAAWTTTTVNAMQIGYEVG